MAIEREIKVLSIDPEAVCQRLEELGATKAYDGIRTITHFDTPNRDLAQAEKSLKLTEEEGLKLTASAPLADGTADEIKTAVGGKEEITEILETLGFSPIAKVEAHRVSYELDGIDYDIDQFPGIPPFLEIDLAAIPNGEQEILERLGLSGNRIVRMSTPQIFQEYGKEYFTEFTLTFNEHG